MITAPINKIIPYSVVDGPGNRVSVFVQGCNLHCAYCHNPETQNLCEGCGLCVEQCPAGALSLSGGKVAWEEDRCCQCDTCIRVCPHFASPKVTRMTPQEVYGKICESIPFIRGITVSGGECSLYPEFLTALFRLVKGRGLTCLMDCNGAVDLSRYPELMELCDGVMLDVKSWDPEVFRALTGLDNGVVKRNLTYLSGIRRLEEVRVVCAPGYVDAEACIRGIAAALGPEETAAHLLKLIRFRPFGVKGPMRAQSAPGMGYMQSLQALAEEAGFTRIQII